VERPDSDEDVLGNNHTHGPPRDTRRAVTFIWLVRVLHYGDMPPKKKPIPIKSTPPLPPEKKLVSTVTGNPASSAVTMKSTNAKPAIKDPGTISAFAIHRHFVAEWLWLLIPSFLASLGWWYGIRQLLIRPFSGEMVWATAALIFATVISYAFIGGIFGLIPYGITRKIFFPIWALVLGVTAFIFHPFSVGTALAALSFAVGLWVAAEGIAREASSRRKVDIRSTLAHVMPWVVIGLSLATALVYYDRAQTHADPKKDTAQLIGRVVEIAESFGPRFINNFRPTMTIDELIDGQLPTAEDLVRSTVKGAQVTDDETDQLQRRLADLGLGELVLPPVGSDAAVVREAINEEIRRSRAAVIDEVRSGLGDQLGISLRGDATVHQALTALVNDRIGSRSAAFVQFVPPILSIGLFLALRLISPILEIFAVGAGWFWYRALRAAHILKKKTVPGTIEVLEWGN